VELSTKLAGAVAQLVEHRLCKPRVIGSNPFCSTTQATQTAFKSFYKVWQVTSLEKPHESAVDPSHLPKFFDITYGSVHSLSPDFL
jgi:hypothetical protein